VPAADLVDRITILRIKARKLAGEKKANVEGELTALLSIRAEVPPLQTSQVRKLERSLATTNHRLWQLEEAVRGLETKSDFGARFISCARSIYLTNDRRAQLKAAINRMVGSELKEEKSIILTAPAKGKSLRTKSSSKKQAVKHKR
jgi:hypothetical protein